MGHYTKKAGVGLAEWLKVKALSSSTSTEKKKSNPGWYDRQKFNLYDAQLSLESLV
jgi:hypothetical protein